MTDDQPGSVPASHAGGRTGLASLDEPPSSPSLFSRLFGWREEAAQPAGPARGQPQSAGGELLDRLRELRRTRVDDVMIPRADIEAVPDDIAPTDLIEVFRRTAITRLPVYHETLDDPQGFIHLKDLALRHGFGTERVAFNLKDLMRPILFVTGSMTLLALLGKMQRERCHVALVIDEYGGVDGLVTFEDVVEEIVGDIEDEHDTGRRLPWKAEGPGVWLADARAELAEFEAATGMRLLTEEAGEDVDTLGGLVFSLAGRVPEPGDRVVHPSGPVFEVLEADSRRIGKLRVREAGPGEG
jgi:magnesium and cobalt transporter